MRRAAFAALHTVAALLAGVCSLAWGASYEAPLPAALTAGPDLCAHAPCREVLPDADSFSERMGRPAYVEAYRHRDGLRQRIGYVFLSTDIVDIPAYSGKPVVTLIGMQADGRIAGVKILRHSEPILLVGIPEEALTRFVHQFVGKYAWDKVEVGQARASGGYIGIDAISGATVTVIAENQVVMRSAYQIARQTGIVETAPKPPAVFSSDARKRSWSELLREGSVERLYLRASDVGETDTRTPLIDLYFGYLNHPAIGRSVLGDAGYQRLMAELTPRDHAIFIVANGQTSFKGSGFVRGGIFDRIQVAQDLEAISFRDTDYLNLYGIEAADAPAFAESGIFIIRSDSFSAAYPWSLVFLANKLDKTSGERSFLNFDREYWLPAQYLAHGRPQLERPEAAWVKIWKSRAVEIAAFALLLLAVALVYAQRDRLTRRASRRNKWPVNAFKYSAWVAAVGFVGFGLMAQPSITQVLTWFHALLYRWTWELFLTDPFIFLFWIFIIVTVFLWGRGLFCGWLCPFGSLSELIYKIAGALGLARFQFKLPKPWHDRLKWIKYAIFYGLLLVSLGSLGLAEKLAEVEPFKTTFLVGLLNRSWPFTLYAAGLLGLSIFIERPFCKYLCPLGAGLAIPSTFRWFGLRRKQECNRCAACAVGCGSQAIDRHGRIDQRECLLCLDCMVLYTDTHACPPLVQERKRRDKAGLPLTPIDAAGYFMPLAAAPAAPIPLAQLRSAGVDPRMPSDAVEPPYADQRGRLRWLLAEAWDHLWPWSRAGFRQPLALQRAIQAAGLALALAVSLVWLLAAAGRVGPLTIIGAWAGWCLFEVLVRSGAKPYVKEGPWWQRRYRAAQPMDLISYVCFKNLLIGATLFIALKVFGMLQP